MDGQPAQTFDPRTFLHAARHVSHRFIFAAITILPFYDDSSEVIMASCLLRLAVMNETYWSFEMSADKLGAFITCRHGGNNSCSLGTNLRRAILSCLLQR